jgi:hypothetical protein
MAMWINACGHVDMCNYGIRPRGRVSEIHAARVRDVDLYTWPHGHLVQCTWPNGHVEFGHMVICLPCVNMPRGQLLGFFFFSNFFLKNKYIYIYIYIIILLYTCIMTRIYPNLRFVLYIVRVYSYI